MTSFRAPASLMLLLCYWFATPVAGQAGLMSPERIHEFGEVGIDFDLFHTFTLINYADEELRVDSVHVSCDCSTVQFTDSTMKPGDTALIRLKFNTKNYYGPVSKAVTVYSNSNISPKLELFYKAVVGQWYFGLKPDPVSLFFLPRKGSKQLRIENMALNKVKIVEISQHDTNFTASIVTASATKGESLIVEVTPATNLTKGTYLGNFRVKIDISDELDPVYLSIPVKIVRY